jgi:serine/threonine protein phosphatase PrpC
MRENNAILPGTLLLIESANQPREQERPSEDYILVTDGLLGVFDSVGGRDKGRLVSHLAGKVIAEAWWSLSETERQGSSEQLESVLQALIRQADTAIAELSIPPEQKRPATTAALCALSTYQGQVYATIAHIGDSRVYLLRAGQPLRRLTKDNGYFSFAVRHQQLTEEEALCIEQAERAEDLSPEQQAHFARRNKITCAVGWGDFPRIQTSSLALFPGDRVLLCSDGIHDNLTDQEIEEILLAATDKPGAQSLVDAAMERSQQAHVRAKRDDISATVAWYRGSC